MDNRSFTTARHLDIWPVIDAGLPEELTPPSLQTDDGDTDMSEPRPPSPVTKTELQDLPEELLGQIMNGMDISTIAAALEVSKTWYRYARNSPRWEALGAEKWDAVKTDPSLPGLLRQQDSRSEKWISVARRSCSCRVAKVQEVMCRIVARQVFIGPGGESKLPITINIVRRIPLTRLKRFTRELATVYYVEPAEEVDQGGYFELIEYLQSRDRAGLAYDGQNHVVLAPPCDYIANQVGYYGPRIIGLVHKVPSQG